jgi:molybdate transport system permease protein
MVAGQDILAPERAGGRCGGLASGAAAHGHRFLPADADGPQRAGGATDPGAGLGLVAFHVQPLQQAFEAIGPRPLEVAATLRAGPWDRFFTVVLPLARPGFLTASVLGFAHTVGEFGVVLMIGGNIPGATRVLSVALYGHVEAMDMARAHVLAGGMVLFGFAVMFVLYLLNGRAAHARASHHV